MVEPRDSGAFPAALADYAAKLEDPNGTGAVLFAVCRGKVGWRWCVVDWLGVQVWLTFRNVDVGVGCGGADGSQAGLVMRCQASRVCLTTYKLHADADVFTSVHASRVMCFITLPRPAPRAGV